MQEIIKEYIDEIIKEFPIYNGKTKRFLKRLDEDINEFVIKENIYLKSDICNRFGTPEEVVENYYEYIEAQELVLGLSNKKVKIAIVAGVVLLFIIWASVNFMYVNKNKAIGITGNTLTIDKSIIYDHGEKVEANIIESRSGQKIKETHIRYKDNRKIYERNTRIRDGKKIKETIVEYENGKEIRMEKTYD